MSLPLPDPVPHLQPVSAPARPSPAHQALSLSLRLPAWWPAGLNYWTTQHDGEVRLRQDRNLYDTEAPLTVHDLLMGTALKYSHYVALGSKRRNGWHLLTYTEYYEECRRAAKAFLRVRPAEWCWWGGPRPCIHQIHAWGDAPSVPTFPPPAPVYHSQLE